MARAPRFAGRARELEVWREALTDVRAGRAATLLVSGDPGIGKSRLVEEASRIAESSGFAIVWGAAWESGGAPAFWPWSQVFRALERSSILCAAPELARLLPELGEAPAGEDAVARFELFDAVLQVLTALARQRPILVLLEDLHAADLPTLELLAFLVAHLRDVPLAIAATYREPEARRAAPRGELLDRIARKATVLRLGPLEPDEVSLLAREIAPEADGFAELYRTTEGNPLFVIELLRSPTASIPESVRAVIRDRIDLLDAEPRAVLEAAAVIGREVSPLLLAAVCLRDPVKVATDLAAAAALGLVSERPHGRGMFTHGLFAEVLRSSLPPAERAELHLRVADELERHPGAPLAEIAHHLLHADAGERAIDAARKAAEHAGEQLAFEEAADLLDRALAIARGTQNAERTTELLLELATARTLGGDAAGGRSAALEAAELARVLGSPRLLAGAALAYGAAFTIGVTDLGLVQLIEEALRALPDEDSDLRARLMGRLAAARQPSSDPGPPMALARDAIAMAQRIGGDRTRLEVLHLAGAALAKLAPPRERTAIDEEACRLATLLGVRSLALRAHARLVFDHLELGDLSKALEHVERHQARASGLHLASVRWPGIMFRALLALYQGRFAEQRALLAEVEPYDDQMLRWSLEMHRIGTLRTIGDDAGLAGLSSSLWAQARPPYPLYDRVLSWMIGVRAHRIDPNAELQHHDPQELVTQRDPVLATWAAEVAAFARDRRWAHALYGWLAEMPERIALQAMHGMFIDGPIARPLMLLADVLDDIAAVERHFEHARSILRSHGARPLEARLLYERACIDSRRGRTRDAQLYLEEARAAARELALPLLARIEEALPRGEGEVVLQREGEYWLVKGLGGSVRVKHSRGMEMLERLVSQPGRAIHSLELSRGPDAERSDAGEVLDARARETYRVRLAELEAELAEAEEWNDAARTERLSAEKEALEAELARAFGLGGRARTSGSTAERARINAQRRIADSIRRIRKAHPALGEHLARSVTTGMHCSYDPNPG
jgi:hypothetical protein